MTGSYEQSRLWKAALEDQGDEYDGQRTTLRETYKKFHQRAALLAAQIRGDLPNLTIHDENHYNGLWHLAGEIAGPDYQLNPAETFVFGGAILLHDAGNCIAAYSKGSEEITQGVEWRDVIAQWGLRDNPPAPGSLEYQAVLLEVLRLLHPKKAKTLAQARWQAPGDTEPMFLLENKELRDYYGGLIGEIAASHGQPTHDIETFATRKITPCASLNPAPWDVDALKLAALLRAADAAHLDATRAPRFLYALTQPNGNSDKHWRFQSKIGSAQADTQRGELLYSSGGNTFTLAESDAWWLAYDTCRMVDNELRTVDRLLREYGRTPFALRAVRGIADPAQFAHDVRTEGWHPVDTSLRIGDVTSLVENFGGAKLYGDKPYLALRELLQNAADAVRALRALGGLEAEEGRIDVELEERDGATWLHVSDNGIGMSRYVLSNVLLDFGKSLWKSTDLRREWPGLAGSGFEATGQFGIGFFSVFMLGDQVKVTTLRYEHGHDQCQVLEFSDGLRQRALLREPLADEKLKRCGTKVSVKLKEKLREALLMIHSVYRNQTTTYPLHEIVAGLVPALDILVRSKQLGADWVTCITPNDWQTLEDQALLERLAPRAHLATKSQSSLAPVVAADGRLLGRCGLGERGAGILVINGIFAGTFRNIVGLLIAENNLDLARSDARPVAGIREMADWANRQRQLIDAHRYGWYHITTNVLALGGDSDGLPLVSRFGQVFDRQALRDFAQNLQEIWFVSDLDSFDSDFDENISPNEFYENYQVWDHCMEGDTLFWEFRQFLDGIPDWPLAEGSLKPRRIEDVLVDTLTEVWGGVEIEAPKDAKAVGKVNGKRMNRPVIIYRKTP